MANPDPFFLPGGPVGLLLIHGFTGSPAELRRIGEWFTNQNLTISAPLLPGHGSTAAHLNRVSWTDWTKTVENAYHQLLGSCQVVFIGGISLGALLTIHLAAHHPELAGAILYAPAIKINGLEGVQKIPQIDRSLILPKPRDYFANPEAEKLLCSYTEIPVGGLLEVIECAQKAREMLPQVTCPLLVVYSPADPVITPDSSQIVMEETGSIDKQIVALHGSGHVVTVDSEWEIVAEASFEFINKHNHKF